MSDVTRYTFKIDGFTPENMPFGRLLEYYAEIKRMLVAVENLHLVEIFPSSHGSAFAIDYNSQSNFQKHLIAINTGTASASALRAQTTINKMLKDDGTSGVFSDATEQNVIRFLGKDSADQDQSRIRDAATFTGELYHIAGSKNDVKLRMRTDADRVVYCTTTREIGKTITKYLFENIKVNGCGMWTRDEKGVWVVDDFSITDFEPVINENLRTAVDRLRDLRIDWPDDPLADISQIEESGGRAQ